ncbi:hypothetical protein [Streptomyces sp. NPDC058548]|uniref:hypothetical protein n=1 Tax=Streptomyces sp. NPDC058548 TaxID=3346545 RepID=UPI003651983C
MPVEPIPCDVPVEPPTPCCSPGVASTGLCLADGTPIAVLAVTACVDCGTATAAPEVSGWLNLLTGTYAAGPPPAGTEACAGQPAQFEVGQWCDIDAQGKVIAPVLVEYEYDDDGQLIGVRTLTPAGQPYTVAGTLGICPGPVDDVEYVILCDTAADGTVTQFLRALTPNGDDTSTARDTLLDGVTPFVPVGEVGVCAPAPCRHCETLTLCDVPSDTTPAPLLLAAGQSGARSGILSNGVSWTASNGTGSVPNWFAVSAFPRPNAGPIDFTFSRPVTVTWGARVGQQSTALGKLVMPVGTQLVSLSPHHVWDPATRTLSPAATAGNAYSTTPSRFAHQGPLTTLSIASDGTSGLNTTQRTVGDVVATPLTVPFLRTACRDCDGQVLDITDTRLDGTPYVPIGIVGVCHPPEEEPCASTVSTLRLCDLDPTVDRDPETGLRCAVPFLRHLVHDCTGALVETRDTAMDGTTPYTVVQVTDCSNGVPALAELLWPQTGITEDPAGVVRQDFIYTITNPQTNAVAQVRLHASTAAGSGCGAYNPASPVFNNPTVYTLTLDAAAQEMSTFRLDLLDFDMFEGITGLSPIPSRVEGNVTWNGSTITANVSNTTAFVFWDNPPAQIAYRYGNTGGGNACSAVAFQGMTLIPEGCCGCDAAAPPETHVDVETLLLCVRDTATGEVLDQVLVERVYDDQSGDMVEQRITDPTTGAPVTLPAGAELARCPSPDRITRQICVAASGQAEFLTNAANATSGQDTDWRWAPNLAGTWFPMYRVARNQVWAVTDPAPNAAHWVSPHQSRSVCSPNPATSPNVPGTWFTRASWNLPADADPATIRIAASILNADNAVVHWRLNDGPWQPVASGTLAPPPWSFPPTAIPGGRAGQNEIVIQVLETAPAVTCPSANEAGMILHVAATYDYQPRSWTQVLEDGRVYYLDENGDRQDAIPAGDRIVPCPGGGGGGECCPTEPCRDTSTVLLCDLDPDCQAGGVPAATDEPDPASFNNWRPGTVPNWCHLDTPGQGAPVWTGGSVVLGPDPACPTSSGGDTHRVIGVRLAAGSPLLTGTVDVTVSLRATNNGPNPGFQGDGRFGLWDASGVPSRITYVGVPGSAPVGAVYPLTLTAAVPAAALAAGDIVAILDLETYHGAGPKAWTVDQFTWSAAVPAVECETQFLRTIVKDCATGATLSTTDTTLDGEPYEATGDVGQCTPADGGPSAPGEDTEVLALCDIDPVAGTVVPFLRQLLYVQGSPEPTVNDTALDGITPYIPAGTVGTCTPPPDGRDVELVPMCLLDVMTGDLLQEITAEIVYDTATGVRLETRFVDRYTGDPVVVPRAGETRLGTCPEPDGCPCHVVERCLCDDTDGDGTGDTDYIELVAVDARGVLTVLGTYTPDYEPYEPVAPIACPSEGAEPAVGIQAHRVEVAPAGSWSAASVALLQSVTMTAHGGTGTIATQDGTSTLHDGESVSWSIVRDGDSALTGPLAVMAVTGTVTVAYTRSVTL